MTEQLAVITVALATAVVLVLLAVLLRLAGRDDFKFHARGFGVSVHLETDSEDRFHGLKEAEAATEKQEKVHEQN